MKVIKRSSHGYTQDPTKNLGFEAYDGHGAADVALIIAAFDQAAGCWDQFELSPAELDAVKKMHVVRLEFEEPNKFFIPENFDAYDGDFYKVLTLCPFTAEYFNERQGVERRVPIFFPFNVDFIPTKCEKRYDIIYTGHLHPKPIMRDMKTISRFNYRLVSNSGHELVTDRGVGYQEKLDLISQSKITLTHNLLYPTVRHVLNVWKYPDWRANKAFTDIPGVFGLLKRLLTGPEIEVPQLKSRIFEAAFCRSLILCKKDSFNVIEKYFTPDKEFIYYEEGRLVETVNKILGNYDRYLPVIDNAYSRAVDQYTSAAFFDKYLKKI
ncbi:glycosyltransferase [Thiobacillus sp.]|uniref:glycosyltransferase n=1 Tax=Thiobacillus sp. TaxID=924 RepID=UPI0025D52122|nr:glycosyltransferase [Thiobacillus sp.]MBT9540098.1 glycosyltransferase family 1 protein [Thiobacillus sp.]